MSKLAKKITMLITAGALMCGMVAMPKVVKAEEPEFIPIELSNGQSVTYDSEEDTENKYITIGRDQTVRTVYKAKDGSTYIVSEITEDYEYGFSPYWGTVNDVPAKQVKIERQGDLFIYTLTFDNIDTFNSVCDDTPCSSTAAEKTPAQKKAEAAQAAAFNEQVMQIQTILSSNGVPVSTADVVNYIVAQQQTLMAQQSMAIQESLVQHQAAIQASIVQQQESIQSTINSIMKNVEEMMAQLMAQFNY